MSKQDAKRGSRTPRTRRSGAAAARYVQSGEAGGDVLRLTAGEGVGYTVPQHIRRENVAKGADVFFRVNRVFKNSVVEVSDGEHVLTTFKREHMAPGEMEHILLAKAVLDKAAGDTVTITAKEA